MDWIEVKKKEPHIIKNGMWVKCIVEIRCNKTREIRECETDEILMNDEKFPSFFMWEDGNCACDCNRKRYFKRSKGEEKEDGEKVECSRGKYSVNLKNGKNGKVFYREFRRYF